MGLHTMSWVDDVRPSIRLLGDDGRGNPTDERIEFLDERLSVPMRNHLLRTLGTDGEGEHHCQAHGCAWRGDGGPCYVGYVLWERAPGAGEELLWEHVTVAEFPDGRILLLCEMCSPSTTFPEA
jgi:hypothetical protein